jgi:hypothetical protein
MLLNISKPDAEGERIKNAASTGNTQFDQNKDADFIHIPVYGSNL